MPHTYHPRQTPALTSLVLLAGTIAACNVVLGIEPGFTWCEGKPPGTSLPNQIDGDCQEVVCDGNGNIEVKQFRHVVVDVDTPRHVRRKNSCWHEHPRAINRYCALIIPPAADHPT